ncbi:MAG: AraC-like DNA-binding protein [Oleiphilaceae bacterium]|jgi:AraC-like DNA-binding protein
MLDIMQSTDTSNLSYAAQLFLWKKRTLYIGKFKEPLNLSLGAATLSVSLGKPFSFMIKGMSKPIYSKSLIIPAGVAITLDTNNSLVANCHLDALGRDFFYLHAQAQKSSGKLSYDLSHEAELVKGFTHIFTTQKNSQEAFDYVESILINMSAPPMPAAPVDPRIEKVIELIQETVKDAITGEALAESVNLSIPRLAQLFKKQTGIPIRRYRLWHRLYLTAQNVGEGKNLTEAAIDAGFTDSPHFAHTFRAMMGMTPSCILSHVNKTRVTL